MNGTDSEKNNESFDVLSSIMRWNNGSPNDIQQTILSQRGTLRLYLSELFDAEVQIEVTSQVDIGCALVRDVMMSVITPDGRLIDVCMATSVISTVSDNPINYRFVELMNGKQIGIGDALRMFGIKMDMNLLSVAGGEDLFNRTYTMHNSAHGISILITETFSSQLYQ